MQDSFGGEGYEYLFALSPSGRRPDRGSLPFKRGGDGDGIVLGLLRHEDGGLLRLGRQRVLLCVVELLSYALFAVLAV